MAVAADPVSPQEFEAMRANPSPTAQWTTVMAWYQAGRIATSDQLNALVTETWSFPRSPARDAGMSVSELVQMFRTAGFITNREHTDGCLRHGAVGRGVTPSNRQIEIAYASAHSAKAKRPADLISAGRLCLTASHCDRARRPNRDTLRIMPIVRKAPDG